MSWFFLISVVFFQTVFAETTCKQPAGFKPVDLRPEFGPVRNQDSVGWCYAFASADLLTHYLGKVEGKHRVNMEDKVSASALALSFNAPQRRARILTAKAIERNREEAERSGGIENAAVKLKIMERIAKEEAKKRDELSELEKLIKNDPKYSPNQIIKPLEAKKAAGKLTDEEDLALLKASADPA